MPKQKQTITVTVPQSLKTLEAFKAYTNKRTKGKAAREFIILEKVDELQLKRQGLEAIRAELVSRCQKDFKPESEKLAMRDDLDVVMLRQRIRALDKQIESIQPEIESLLQQLKF